MAFLGKKTPISGIWLAPLVVSMCCLTCCGYVFLSQGLIDDMLSEHNRDHMLEELERARNAEPPDFDFLVSRLRSRDWIVATRAARYIGSLRQENRLTPEQTDVAVEKLWEAIASGGHWWRFGWDIEDPEYSIFEGTAHEVVAGFSNRALPRLLAAGSSRSQFERQAFCWAVYISLKEGTVSQNVLDEMGILHRVADLAQNDSDSYVQYSCNEAQQLITSLP